MGRAAEALRGEAVNSRTAPRAATWLLERLGAGSRGGSSRFEPLIGDLLEQFQGGRSRLWYWRQAVGALAIDGARTLRIHAPTFIAAVVVGCGSIWLWNWACAYAFGPLYENLSAISRHPWTSQAALRIAGMQLHALLGDALLLATVWAVTRIHRPHPRAVLVALVFAMSAPSLPGFARLVIHTATVSPSSVTSWVPVLMSLAFPAVCTLAAGLWAIRTPRFADMDVLTRVVAAVAVAVFVLVALAHRAQLVGELTYTLRVANVFALLDIGSIAYLAFLLWRQNSTSQRVRSRGQDR